MNLIACLNVKTGKVFGKCFPKKTIKEFDEVLDEAIDIYKKQAKRIFIIVDNGSAHHPNTFTNRINQKYDNVFVLHTPTHASWINQIEIYFSILQRKVLTPNYFDDPFQLVNTILAFQERYNQSAKPFNWKFTSKNLKERLRTLN
jgi:hypothetical protein